MATPKRQRAVQIDDSPLPTATKQEVLMSQDEEQRDSDVPSDSDPSGSERASTSSDSEEDTNGDFGVQVPEAEFGKVDTILHQQYPWIKDVDDSSRDILRLFLFQCLVKLCGRLDQKYSYDSPESYVLIRDLFDANPRLVSEIDKCWSNPEGSFLPICNLGEYFGIIRIPFNHSCT